MTHVLYSIAYRVSIHAPAGGATTPRRPATTSGMFQSTHPQGVRRIYGRPHEPYHRFQSTHPQGVRLGYSSNNTGYVRFNPRTRRGCDTPG